MRFLDCTECTEETYVSEPYVCPNCGAPAYWLSEEEKEAIEA